MASPSPAQGMESEAQLGASYTSDTLANLSGGRTAGLRQLGLLELTAQSSDRLFGITGGQAFASVQHVHGQSFTDELVGDAQVVSNIDAPGGLRLFEAWVALPISASGTLKAGLIDLNGEFDVQETGALFLNSSHGIGPDFSQSGLNGPSIFPTTATAIMFTVEQKGWTFRAGAFDALAGDPDRPKRTIVRFPGESGLLLVGEAELTVAQDRRIQFGGWTYTNRFEALDGTDRRKTSHGAYALIEGRLVTLGAHPVQAWIRVGAASSAANPISTYVGGGLATGPDERRIGLAVAHARLGRDGRRFLRRTGSAAETILEITFAHSVGDRLIVQPDFQYVINPGFDPGSRNAVVAGLRLHLRLL